jgi:hypothetical protein
MPCARRHPDPLSQSSPDPTRLSPVPCTRTTTSVQPGYLYRHRTPAQRHRIASNPHSSPPRLSRVICAAVSSLGRCLTATRQAMSQPETAAHGAGFGQRLKKAGIRALGADFLIEVIHEDGIGTARQPGLPRTRANTSTLWRGGLCAQRLLRKRRSSLLTRAGCSSATQCPALEIKRASSNFVHTLLMSSKARGPAGAHRFRTVVISEVCLLSTRRQMASLAYGVLPRMTPGARVLPIRKRSGPRPHRPAAPRRLSPKLAPSTHRRSCWRPRRSSRNAG